MKAIIVGGGVGGLASSIALQKIGWDVEVLERSSEPRVDGAGLLIQPNAVPALDELGVGEAARAKGNQISEGVLLSATGRTTSEMDLTLEGARPAALGIHRAVLQSVLLANLDPQVVEYGVHVVSATDRGARSADGTIRQADIVVVADGIHSAIGEALGAPPLRYAGYTCWRGVCANDGEDGGTLYEISGRGRRFGVVPISKEQIYWFATLNAPRGEQDDPKTVQAVVRKHFSMFPARVNALVSSTSGDAILRNDIIDRPPRTSWGRGNLTLLGDAAHPMTPNLGQGASQALVDALCLQRHLAGASSNEIEERLRAYEEERIEKTTRIVNASWQFGRVGQLESSVLRWLRDLALKWTPQSVTRKQVLELTG